MFTLPRGDDVWRFPIPGTWRVDRLPERAREPGLPPAEAAAAALAAPLGTPRLAELARGVRRVTIAVPDATRATHEAVLLPALLAELAVAGISADAVTVAFSLGMHRPTTAEERAAKLGDLGDRVRTVDCHGNDPDLVDLGRLEDEDLPAPVPVHLNRAVVDTDLLLALGRVEVHQMAGLSGGSKTVALGCAGRETIGALHGLPFLEHPETVPGRLAGNRMRRGLDRIGERAGLRFVLDLVPGPDGTVHAAAGDPGQVLMHLSARVDADAWATPPDRDYDAVFLGVPSPKDANLYQASRPLTYLAVGSPPVLAPGGVFVLAARCPEGFGEGAGERNFAAWMRGHDSPAEVVAAIRREESRAGGQRAFLVARALERFAGLVVGADPDALAGSHLAVAPDPEAGLAWLTPRLPADARVLVVEDGFGRLPRLA